jgi:hypothetical protein
MSKFSFGIAENTAVVTSTYVVNENMPILYVSHEYDDEEGEIWQFHCGNDDYDMNKMLLVSLGDVLSLDGSLSELADLPLNKVARRKHVGDEWIYSTE